MARRSEHAGAAQTPGSTHHSTPRRTRPRVNRCTNRYSQLLLTAKLTRENCTPENTTCVVWQTKHDSETQWLLRRATCSRAHANGRRIPAAANEAEYQSIDVTCGRNARSVAATRDEPDGRQSIQAMSLR